MDWLWPASEHAQSRRWQPDEQVRLLTPFDPLVWDRRRFELLWGWAYRFEAYTPAPKRNVVHRPGDDSDNGKAMATVKIAVNAMPSLASTAGCSTA